MKTFEQHLEAKGITKEAFQAKSAEEIAGIYNEYNDANHKELEALVDSKATKEDINSLKEEMNKVRDEQYTHLKEILKQQGLTLKKLAAGEKNEKTPATIAEQLKSGIDTLKALKSGEKVGLNIKAPADMLLSTNVSPVGSVPLEQRLPGLNDIASRRVTLFDVAQRGRAESNVISWVYKANRDGATGQTAEGALKNQIDFDLVVDSESVKKSTAYIKVSDEMLDDVSFMESEIRNELLGELLRHVESQVYEGDGTGQNLNGIRTIASAFAAGSFAGTVDNPNFVDVLRVAMDQIMVANQEMPTAIFAHPSDVTALKLIKVTTTDKRYIDQLQMIGGQLSLDGVPIIASTLVTKGEYLIGNFNLATIYDKGEVSIEIGFDSDDFTKNLRTIRAEWRGLVIVKNNDRTAFVAGVIATDAAALETP